VATDDEMLIDDVPAGRIGACPPPSCDDGIACTTDVRIGEGCTARCLYTEILAFDPGDGCCPTSANHQSDPDCSATCGSRSCAYAVKPIWSAKSAVEIQKPATSHPEAFILPETFIL